MKVVPLTTAEICQQKFTENQMLQVKLVKDVSYVKMFVKWKSEYASLSKILLLNR